MKHAYPAFGPDQVKQYLMRYARDLGLAGVDSAFGAGELQLPQPPDVVAPSGRALVSSGRRGRTIKLLASVADDSGEVSVVEVVKRGSKTIATIRRDVASATSAKTVATPWKVPKSAAGAYKHCVRVADRAGNTSALSCARLVLR